MPIITPAYPAMCATHNIGPTTKKIIIQELERGGDITDKISFGRLQWKDLFQKHTYFTRDYKYYLSIISGSTSKEAQASWSGFVESKVRLLVQSLEGQGSIGVARLFNKGFAREHRCKDENEIEAVLHGDMQYQATNVKTETTDKINDPRHNAIAEGNVDAATIANGDGETAQNGNSPHAFYTTTYYIGIELAQGPLRLSSLDGLLTCDRFYQETRCLRAVKRLERAAMQNGKFRGRSKLPEHCSNAKVGDPSNR